RQHGGEHGAPDRDRGQVHGCAASRALAGGAATAPAEGAAPAGSAPPGSRPPGSLPPRSTRTSSPALASAIGERTSSSLGSMPRRTSSVPSGATEYTMRRS